MKLFLLALSLAFAAGVQAQDYYVYVAAESDDEVALVRFDGEDATVAKTIPVGVWPTEIEGPHGLAISEDGAYWYLSLAHGTPYGRILKYATGTDEEVGSVTAGLFPATMAISPATGLLYAVNFNLHGHMVPSTVSVVDPATMTEIVQVETGAMPHGSRVSADGLKHYSAAMMDGMLYEIDAQTLEVTRTLYTGTGNPHAHHAMDGGAPAGETAMTTPDHPTPKPTWVAPHPSKDLVYVANNGADEIVEVDTEAWDVTRRFATGKGPYNLAVTPDGRQLVATYKSEATTGIWDLETGTEVARVPNSRKVSHGVVVSPDGRYAFVSVEGIGGEPGAVDVIDLASYERTAVAEVGKQAGGIAFWKMEE